MNIEALAENWALWLALAILLPVFTSVGIQMAGRSSSGQLRKARSLLAEATARQRAADAAVDKTEARLDQLMQKHDSVKPRVLQEAKDALTDSRSLAKIADDKVLVARNHLRRVIVEEYPPHKHERMRDRYLPADAPDGKPFTF